MQDYTWVPIALSAVGTLLSFFAMLCVTVIGFLVKYVLQNTERRILQLETKTETHASSLATAAAQTVSEQKTLGELRDEIRELRSEVRTILNARAVVGAPRLGVTAQPSRDP
jgi:hypothetical protein